MANLLDMNLLNNNLTLDDSQHAAERIPSNSLSTERERVCVYGLSKGNCPCETYIIAVTQRTHLMVDQGLI